MHNKQGVKECLDTSVNRCKFQAKRCEFKDDELSNRIIGLIIASTQIPVLEFQKELLEK